MTYSLGLINLLGPLTELRETLPFTTLLNATIKDADEQPDEVIRQARSARVSSTGASVPESWGVLPSQYLGVFTDQETLYWDFYGGFIRYA